MAFDLPRNWPRLRSAVLKREPLCRHCAAQGRVTRACEVDHIVPRHKGGSHSMSNLQPLCADCHKQKTAADCGKFTPTPIGTNGWPLGPDHHWNRGRASSSTAVAALLRSKPG